MNLNQKYGNLENFSQVFGQGEWKFDALVGGIVAKPTVRHGKFGLEFSHVILSVFKGRRDGAKQDGVVVAKHLIGAKGRLTTALEAIAELTCILVFRRAELQMVGLTSGRFFETHSEFGRTLVAVMPPLRLKPRTSMFS